VLAGERQSRRLMARYEALKSEQAAATKAANKGNLDG
jgi:hypothetical protein